MITEWLRHYGALALLGGGMVLYVVVLGLDVSGVARLPFPYSFFWLVIVGLPAAGLAILFRQAIDDREDDDAVYEELDELDHNDV
jgi:hypothetical protein